MLLPYFFRLFFLLLFFLIHTSICQRSLWTKNDITLTVTNFANKFVRAMPLLKLNSYRYRYLLLDLLLALTLCCSSVCVCIYEHEHEHERNKMSRSFFTFVKWWDGCEKLNHPWNVCYVYFSRDEEKNKKNVKCFHSTGRRLCYAKNYKRKKLIQNPINKSFVVAWKWKTRWNLDGN